LDERIFTQEVIQAG